VSAVNLNEILRKCIPLGLILAFSSPEGWAKSLPQESPSVAISVFNEAGISPTILKQAEEVASRVFEESGIHVEWVNCSPAEEALGHEAACPEAAFPDHLHVHIVRRSLNMKDSVLGVSFLSPEGSGCQADVFYEGIERIYRESLVHTTVILGHVMAHEIGHLLLGINSHSVRGIMRAHWDKEDLTRAEACTLLFAESQSRRMAQRLRTAMAREKCPSADLTELLAEE
jgi:hypothetical protein